MSSQLPEKISLSQISKKISALALPMAGTQLVTISSNFLCMTMLAKLGHQVLAASALIFSAQTSVMIIGMSILFSLNVLIGHAFGEKNYLSIGNYLQQAWTLAFILAIPLIIIFWNIGSILILLGQSKPIADIVQTYFHAFVWGVVPMLLAVCNQQFCYGIHKQKIVMLASFLSILVLIPIAYILIFGKLGMPKLGVAGLAYAVSAQSTFFVMFTTFIFCRDESFKSFDLFTYRVHKYLDHVVKMLKIGWPISLQIGGELFSFFINAMMIGWLGVTALAAYQVVNQYLFLIVVPIFALSQASGILVGQAKGAKQFHEIKLIGFATISVALILSFIVAIIFLLFPHVLASAYINVKDPANNEVIHLIYLLFSVVAFSQIIDGVRNVLTGALRGLFDTKVAMLIGLIVIWCIGIPLGYILAFVLHLGVVGIVVGSAIGFLVGAMSVLYRWHQLTKVYR